MGFLTRWQFMVRIKLCIKISLVRTPLNDISKIVVTRLESNPLLQKPVCGRGTKELLLKSCLLSYLRRGATWEYWDSKKSIFITENMVFSLHT